MTLFCDFKSFLVQFVLMRIKQEIWLSPMTKSLTPTEMWKGQIDKTKDKIDATTKFDYKAISDRHRMVSWSTYDHATGVVNRFWGLTFPLPAAAVESKGHTYWFKHIVGGNDSMYMDISIWDTPKLLVYIWCFSTCYYISNRLVAFLCCHFSHLTFLLIEGLLSYDWAISHLFLIVEMLFLSMS